MIEIIAKFCVAFYMVFISLLFYYQHQRQEKLRERQLLISKWCETLMDNDKILASDFQKLFNEFQTYKKTNEERKRGSKEG